MNYHPYGPFEIARDERNRIDKNKEVLTYFWNQVNSTKEELSEAIGCYIFSIRAGRGILPWYVGLAEKQSFRQECFALHKVYNYNDSIAKRKGTPIITLIPKLTSTGKFAKNTKRDHPDIQFLEKMLIGMAVRRNSNLLNIKNTKLLKEMVVPGILNNPPGRHNQNVIDLVKIINGS